MATSKLQEDLLRILSGVPGGLRVMQCREVIKPTPVYIDVFHALQSLCKQGLVQKVSVGRYARVSSSGRMRA